MSKVLFWTASTDGSSWYRADQPAMALQWSGHQTGVAEQVSAELVLEADVVVGSRISNEKAAEYWVELCAEPKVMRPTMVIDLDDDYWSIDPTNPAAKVWDEAQLGRLAQTCRAADLVTVVSETLKQHVVQHTGADPDKVKVIPNGLHASWLGTPRQYVEPTPERPLVVGWAGTASSSRDFDLVARSLARIVNHGAGRVKLRLVGLPENHPSIRTLQDGILPEYHELVEAVVWVKHGQEYLSAVAGFDIWVAPYRPDPFVLAKFPTKALEAGFLGIPLIASDVLPYREWDDAEVRGVALVDPLKPWMWGRYLLSLYMDAPTRRAIGEAGRSRAAANIMQSVAQVWERALGIDPLG